MKVKQQRATYQSGSVSLDRRRQVWYLRWRDQGVRKAKTLSTLAEIPNKAAARKRAGRELLSINARSKKPDAPITMRVLVQRYVTEKLPTRFSTRNAYTYNLNNHILPKWGSIVVSDLKPYAVEQWLRSLALAPKTKVHIRGLLRILLDLAMLWEYLPCGRNPMELVKIEGASKRTKEPTSLTAKEFHAMLGQISREPHRTMVLTAMCLGLRVSELLALRWKDIDWEHLRISIERGIVRNRVDEVKTRYSAKPMPMDPGLAALLLRWRGKSEFVRPADWVWASPAMAGEKPLFYSSLLRTVQNAGKKIGLDRIGRHTFRHTYRSWLDETGAPMGVQQKLMRHSDIRTTMNLYGDAIPKTMRKAHAKVVKMAIRA
jgi:integrase